MELLIFLATEMIDKEVYAFRVNNKTNKFVGDITPIVGTYNATFDNGEIRYFQFDGENLIYIDEEQARIDVEMVTEH